LLVFFAFGNLLCSIGQLLRKNKKNRTRLRQRRMQ